MDAICLQNNRWKRLAESEYFPSFFISGCGKPHPCNLFRAKPLRMDGWTLTYHYDHPPMLNVKLIGKQCVFALYDSRDILYGTEES